MRRDSNFVEEIIFMRAVKVINEYVWDMQFGNEVMSMRNVSVLLIARIAFDIDLDY